MKPYFDIHDNECAQCGATIPALAPYWSVNCEDASASDKACASCDRLTGGTGEMTVGDVMRRDRIARGTR